MEKAVKWSVFGLLGVLIVGLSFTLGFVLRMASEGDSAIASPKSAVSRNDNVDFSVLAEIYDALKDNYVDPQSIDPELLRTGAINGLINAVGDVHQVYLTKEAREFGDTDLKGQFEGIGATVDQKGGEIIISRPFDGSPAQKAGIKIGDAILEVNGESTKGWTTQQAVAKIRGKRGTEVKLKVRHLDGKTEDLSVVRDEILLPSVRVDVPNDSQGNQAKDIGYIRIEQFTARTGDELKDALRTARDQSYKGMILDLRNNPGGLVSACINVASQFMKGNSTVFIEQHRGGEEERYATRDGGLAIDIPLTVLVNHNSASCSEIIAGALKDNNRAVVMGETTLGKGTVNQFIDLKNDGGAVYVTIGRWLTPNRDQIEGRGVKPNIDVAAADNEDPLGYFNAVMYRAVDYLRNGG
jgi:carboxyl-terminal processing protease